MAFQRDDQDPKSEKPRLIVVIPLLALSLTCIIYFFRVNNQFRAQQQPLRSLGASFADTNRFQQPVEGQPDPVADAGPAAPGTHENPPAPGQDLIPSEARGSSSLDPQHGRSSFPVPREDP